MILTLPQTFELDLPNGWFELPPTSILASDEWIFEWVENEAIAVDHREALVHSLEQTADFVRTTPDADRTWVVIKDPSNPDTITTLASLTSFVVPELSAPRDGTVSRALSSIANPPLLEQVIGWSSFSIEETLAGHPAIAQHDVMVLNTPDGPSLAERYVGTVFFDASATVVQLQIFVQQATSLRDLVVVGNRVLDTVRSS
jgi:hypothetical protein